MITSELHRFILSLVPKIAMEHVLENPERIFERISAKVSLMENENEFDYPEFNLNVQDHLDNDNLHDALFSKGCGCKLCLARKRWARANRLIKLQNNFTSTEGFERIASRYYGDDYAPNTLTDSNFMITEYNTAYGKYNYYTIKYYNAGLDELGIKLSKKVKIAK